MLAVEPPDAGVLKIRVLGRLEVVRDGELQSLPASRKARGLLAYLALAGRPCRREELCDLLWEDVSDPRGELRWALCKLAPILGPWLATSRDEVSVRTDNLFVDASRVRHQPEIGLSEAGIRVLLANWRGPALGFAEVPNMQKYSAWWTAEREALTGLRQELWHRLIDFLAERPKEALTAARQLVAEFPFDERAHSRVADALTAIGRETDARSYIEETRLKLSSELGLPPSAIMTDYTVQSGLPRCSAAKKLIKPKPYLYIEPLELTSACENLKACSIETETRLIHELWRSRCVDIITGGARPAFECTSGSIYFLRGTLARVRQRLHLSLQCSKKSGLIIWSALFDLSKSQFGENHTWLGAAIAGIIWAIDSTEAEAEYDHETGAPRPSIARSVLGLLSTASFDANKRAQILLDDMSGTSTEEPAALALSAWCRAQRLIYNWSSNPGEDRADARSMIKAATALCRDSPTFLTVLGAAHSQLSDQVAAQTLLNRSLQLFPYGPLAHSRSGYVALYLDQAEHAIRHFREALRLAPNDPSLFNTLSGVGIAHYIRGEPRAAIEWMEKGLAMNPRAIWIYRTLVPAYFEAGMLTEAECGVKALQAEYPGLSVEAVSNAMVLSRETMGRMSAGLYRSGLPDH